MILTRICEATAILSILLASLLWLAVIPKAAEAAPDVISVSPGSKIQDAVNAANPGDVILVAPGNYPENVVINQTVTLKGSGQNETFLRATSSTKAAIEIQVNNVNLTGFTIRDGLIGVSISNCNLSTISSNNIILNSNQGIYLSLSHNNIIENNTISLNRNEGVFLLNSTHNLISNNVVTKNEYTGIDLLRANQNRISNNTISFHTNVTFHDQGVWIDSSQNNTVDGNIILHNAYNIDMIKAANNTFHSNIIADGFHGVELDVSDDNTFYHNNLLNNALQVSSYRSTNTWDNSSLSEGNYWSDYREKYPNAAELDTSGIWNTTYIIDADNNDTYPLVNRWQPPVSDLTPPVTTDDYDGLWRNHDFVIMLIAEDFSGINETYYIINDAPTVSNVSANGHPLITTEGATNRLQYWSVDNATNEEPHKILTGIKLDKTPPYGSVIIDDNDTYTTSPVVMLTLFGDDLLSGISQMRFSNDQVFWSSLETYVTNKTWVLSPGDGLKTVYAQFGDNAGVISQTYSDAILLDTLPPTVSIGAPMPNSEIKSSQVTVEWVGTDVGAGIDRYDIRIDGSFWTNIGAVQGYTFSGLGDGPHTVDLKAIDRVGHESVVSVSFVVNTTPIGGPGYIEEAILILAVIVVVAVAILLLRLRKKRAKP
jgi:parallel beta-helix repeat protein